MKFVIYYIRYYRSYFNFFLLYDTYIFIFHSGYLFSFSSIFLVVTLQHYSSFIQSSSTTMKTKHSKGVSVTTKEPHYALSLSRPHFYRFECFCLLQIDLLVHPYVQLRLKFSGCVKINCMNRKTTFIITN